MTDTGRHLENLQKYLTLALGRQYRSVSETIDVDYFNAENLGSDTTSMAFSRSADDFIYKMDITELSYSKTFDMAYRAILDGNFKEYILGLKVIRAKLAGNQRFRYFDRDQMRDLLARMSAENDLFLAMPSEAVQERAAVTDILPVGFPGMSLTDYRRGSLRSVYRQQTPDEYALFKEYFQLAVDQGNFYHHIVELDHFLNHPDTMLSKAQFAYLFKLLLADYYTEKYPWSDDLTDDLLSACHGLRACCGEEEFKTMLLDLVVMLLKQIFKRVTPAGLPHLVGFLNEVYQLDPDERYLTHIRQLTALIQP